MLFRKRRKLLEVGEQAADFRLPRLDGAETSLSEIVSAQPVAIVFFKISCPVCQLELPFLERLHQASALTVYGVSQNDAESTREFAQRFDLTFPILLDGKANGYPVSNAFGISSVPTVLRLDANRVVADVMEGWNKKEISAIAQPAGVILFPAGVQVPEWKAG